VASENYQARFDKAKTRMNVSEHESQPVGLGELADGEDLGEPMLLGICVARD
jgi:hypothetical protein